MVTESEKREEFAKNITPAFDFLREKKQAGRIIWRIMRVYFRKKSLKTAEMRFLGL